MASTSCPSNLEVDLQLQPDVSHKAQLPLHRYQRRAPSDCQSAGPASSHSATSSHDPFVITTRSGCAPKVPAHLSDFHLHVAESSANISLPTTVEAALLHPGWKSAIEDELTSIYKNDTWDLVPLPLDRKAISTKWVFRVKTNADGSTAKLKARLVARGFQQKEGQDYTETFAPVVKWNTLRSVVALAGHHGWQIVHLDVKTAFLNGDMTEDIYISPPPGFSSSSNSQVCKLKKALYGLKQAPRAWYVKIDSYLLAQGLRKSQADFNLYFHEQDGLLTLLLLYVDDVYLTGNDSKCIALIRSHIKGEFEMSDLGLLSYSLGLEFLFRPEGILFTQRQYILELLTEFGLADCKPVATPMAEKLRLTLDMAAPVVDCHRYQRMVGKLIFLTHTRPDICYAVSVVSRFMVCPQELHLQVVKHILHYLQGTAGLALLYRQWGIIRYLAIRMRTGPQTSLTKNPPLDSFSCLEKLPLLRIPSSSQQQPSPRLSQSTWR